MNHPEEFTKTTPNHIVKWVLKERKQAARESDGEATTVDDGVGGMARRRASGTRVARRRCQNGVVLGETRGARGGVDGGAVRGRRRRGWRARASSEWGHSPRRERTGLRLGLWGQSIDGNRRVT